MIERRTQPPAVPFSIFRLRTLRGANIVGLLIGMSLFAMFFFISLYLQQVLGYDALKAGLRLPAAGADDHRQRRASRRSSSRAIGFKPTLIAGMLLVAAGLLWFSQVVARTARYLGDVLFPSLLAAVGLGLRVRAGDDRARSPGTRPDEAGLASGLINTSQQVGGALGLAILAAVANRSTERRVRRRATRNPAVALTEGFQDAFLVGAGLRAARRDARRGADLLARQPRARRGRAPRRRGPGHRRRVTARRDLGVGAPWPIQAWRPCARSASSAARTPGPTRATSPPRARSAHARRSAACALVYGGGRVGMMGALADARAGRRRRRHGRHPARPRRARGRPTRP